MKNEQIESRVLWTPHFPLPTSFCASVANPTLHFSLFTLFVPFEALEGDGERLGQLVPVLRIFELSRT